MQVSSSFQCATFLVALVITTIRSHSTCQQLIIHQGADVLCLTHHLFCSMTVPDLMSSLPNMYFVASI